MEEIVMEDYMKGRPKRTTLPKSEQRKIFEKAKKFVLKDLLPNPKINKIVMFGSIAKGMFGEYKKPFKGRSYSDIDVLLLVEDDFKAPKSWKPHFSCKMYDVFNITRLDGKILVQYMVSRRSSYQDREYQKESENWGVPLLLEKSRHKNIVLYEKGSGQN